MYPPFFQGTHSTIMAWLTFLIVVLMHVFCFVDKKVRERSLWSFAYALYHLFLIVWFLLAMGYAYTWSSKQ